LHQQLDSSSLLTLVVLGLGTLQINIHVVIMPLALRRRKDGVPPGPLGPFARERRGDLGLKPRRLAPLIAVAHK
jgi:hypothetical protein